MMIFYYLFLLLSSTIHFLLSSNYRLLAMEPDNHWIWVQCSYRESSFGWPNNCQYCIGMLVFAWKGVDFSDCMRLCCQDILFGKASWNLCARLPPNPVVLPAYRWVISGKLSCRGVTQWQLPEPPRCLQLWQYRTVLNFVPGIVSEGSTEGWWWYIWPYINW